LNKLLYETSLEILEEGAFFPSPFLFPFPFASLADYGTASFIFD